MRSSYLYRQRVSLNVYYKDRMYKNNNASHYLSVALSASRYIEESQNEILHQFNTTGYGFTNFVNQDDYGIAALSNQRIMELSEGTCS